MANDLLNCNTVWHLYGPGVRIVRRKKMEVIQMAKAILEAEPEMSLSLQCHSRIGSQKANTWKLVSEEPASEAIATVTARENDGFYIPSSEYVGNTLASCG